MKAEKLAPVVDPMNKEQMAHNLAYNMEGTLTAIWQVYPDWRDRQAMMAALCIFCESVFIPALRDMKPDVYTLFQVCQKARTLKERKDVKNVRPVLTVVRAESNPE